MDQSVLFPYEEVRPKQDQLIKSIQEAIKQQKTLVVHAPTGLGKTISALGPALQTAIAEGKTVCFLTSRHTQHAIALETLKAIQDAFKIDFSAISIIGKKHLCLQPHVQGLRSKDFADYCKAMVKDGKCKFYENSKQRDKLSVDTKLILNRVKNKVITTELMVDEGTRQQVCPYEVSMFAAKEAKVIVTDYFYLFNSHIRQTFFKKLDKELSDVILVVDEAHNLPTRVKDLASEYLSATVLKKAYQEAKKYGHETLYAPLQELINWFDQTRSTFHEKALDSFQSAGASTAKKRFDEKYIKREEFIIAIENIIPYEDLIEQCTAAGDAVREEQQQSYIGSVGKFLAAWLGGDQGFTRILALKSGHRDEQVILSYRCLDPSLITKDVFYGSHASILMSGTLTPTDMYAHLLGIEDALQEELKSPFPEENRLNMIIPKTTTKFAKRTQEQFQEIAKVLAEVTDAIPGNTAVFFPSYFVKERISQYFATLNKKTILEEHPGMSKQDKETILEKFKSNSKNGSILLAVINGSFGEGIDLPGDFLKGVIIVGLPLTRPDLETEALIKYYDERFGKGWDYGYLFPAFQKVLQGAGRCIRSGTDRGVVIFLDERYTWPNYARCFPTKDMKISLLYTKMIENFFERT